MNKKTSYEMELDAAAEKHCAFIKGPCDFEQRIFKAGAAWEKKKHWSNQMTNKELEHDFYYNLYLNAEEEVKELKDALKCCLETLGDSSGMPQMYKHLLEEKDTEALKQVKEILGEQYE